MNIYDQDPGIWMVNFAIIGAFLDILDFLKLFNGTRYLLRLVFITIIKLNYFMLFLGLIIVGFALLIFVNTKGLEMKKFMRENREAIIKGTKSESDFTYIHDYKVFYKDVGKVYQIIFGENL